MKKDNSTVQSILRTLLILEQFSNSLELGIIEISQNTGLPASTVQRIVNTLETRNYLMQNPKTNKYKLGIAFYAISRSYSEHLEWIDGAKLHMQKFVNKHAETVNLAVLQGSKITYLTKVDSPNILRPNFNVGAYYPAFCTALGRCMLAFQSDRILDTLLEAGIEPCTEKSIANPEKLKQELAKIKADGYAIEDEEFQVGLLCIAAPIKDLKGNVVAAISTTIPKYRVNIQKIPEITNDLIATANNISAELLG